MGSMNPSSGQAPGAGEAAEAVAASEAAEGATPTAAVAGAGTGDEALERLLAEEEEIERRTRDQHHDVPHFRRDND